MQKPAYQYKRRETLANHGTQTIFVPDGMRWEKIRVHVHLVTGVAVANRYIIFEEFATGFTGSVIYPPLYVGFSTLAVASKTLDMHLSGDQADFDHADLLDTIICNRNIPDTLESGDRITIVFGALDAGDVCTTWLEYYEVPSEDVLP